jgi:hypothetical protein
MIADEIRELQTATPFEPYSVVTSDGKRLYVKHPDYCFITPGNDHLYIFSDEVKREIVATRNITRVPGGRKSRSRRRK